MLTTHRIPRLRVRRRGFTFLEIMFVVVIIGILLALVGPRLVGRTKQARITATQTQLVNLGNAIKAYEMDMGDFPEDLEDLIENPGDDDSWNGPYIDSDVVPKDAWGSEFMYDPDGDNNRAGFDLWSIGPDKTDNTGDEDDLPNWTRSE